MPFSPQRALRRNRVIHTLGQLVLAAQSRAGIGGTWSGTAQNLQSRWTPVCVFHDGSEGEAALRGLGAETIGLDALQSLSDLCPHELNLFEV